MPPLFRGELEGVAAGRPARLDRAGSASSICLCGIVVSGLAGRSKEREMTDEQKREAVREFRFGRGVVVATISGILSACMSYGFDAGKPIAALAVRHGAHPLWQNLPVLVVVLAGGFTTNALWCLFLNARNGTTGERVSWAPPAPHASAISAGTTCSVPSPGRRGISSSSSTGWGTT